LKHVRRASPFEVVIDAFSLTGQFAWLDVRPTVEPVAEYVKAEVVVELETDVVSPDSLEA